MNIKDLKIGENYFWRDTPVRVVHIAKGDIMPTGLLKDQCGWWVNPVTIVNDEKHCPTVKFVTTVRAEDLEEIKKKYYSSAWKMFYCKLFHKMERTGERTVRRVSISYETYCKKCDVYDSKIYWTV